MTIPKLCNSSFDMKLHTSILYIEYQDPKIDTKYTIFHYTYSYILEPQVWDLLVIN